VVQHSGHLETFRSRLEEIVGDSGVSRTAFAEQAGIDRSTLSQLLGPANGRLPRLDTLLAIAQKGEVSIDWLVGLSNDGPMQAQMIQEQTAFEPLGPADNEERLVAWLTESVGYKVRYVPSTIPDLLKTSAVIRYELERYVAATPKQRIETASARLAWARSPDTEMECCSSVQSLRSLARGEGIWADLGRNERVAQLDHIAQLTDELYPTLRWFLFDGLERYAAPVTIFGPLRASLYLGQLYLVLTSSDHVRTLTRHFDELIRGAVVQPPDIVGHVIRLRQEVTG
jgi:transcriptional regulator with XRE-family HTH domain